MRPDISLKSLFIVFFFGFFFGFLEVVATFGQKQKTSRNKKRKHQEKKQKKTKKQKQKQRLGDYMRPDISLKSLFFLGGFLEVFLCGGFLTDSSKNLEDQIQQRLGRHMRPGISFKSLGCRECGREAGTRGLKTFGVLFGNL